MFDHVAIRVADRVASERFYETVPATLGTGRTHSAIGFGAPSRGQVDAFWRTETGSGYRDDGPPGPRPQYSEVVNHNRRAGAG